MTKLRHTRLTRQSRVIPVAPPYMALPPGLEPRHDSWGHATPVIRCKTPAQARALAKRGGRTDQVATRRCILCDWREEETIVVCADGTSDGYAEAILDVLGAAHAYYCSGTPGVVAPDLRAEPTYGGIGVTQSPDWEALAYERGGVQEVADEHAFIARWGWSS